MTIKYKLKASKLSENIGNTGKAKAYFFTGVDGKRYSLSFKQKTFCDLFLNYQGSSVEAIIDAGYKVKSRKVAASLASEYLTKPDVSAYINKRLEEYGYTDENVKRQHLFLINQFADLTNKAKGINMYYKAVGGYKEKGSEEEIKSFFDGIRGLIKDYERERTQTGFGASRTVLTVHNVR